MTASPGPNPPPLHLKAVRVDNGPITTVVTFQGKNYTVTYTPLDLQASGKASSYTDDAVKKIEQAAFAILKAQHETNAETLQSAHTICALFTARDASEELDVKVHTKTATSDFAETNLSTEKLKDIAQKIQAIYKNEIATQNSSITEPLHPTSDASTASDPSGSPTPESSGVPGRRQGQMTISPLPGGPSTSTAHSTAESRASSTTHSTATSTTHSTATSTTHSTATSTASSSSTCSTYRCNTPLDIHNLVELGGHFYFRSEVEEAFQTLNTISQASNFNRRIKDLYEQLKGSIDINNLDQIISEINTQDGPSAASLRHYQDLIEYIAGECEHGSIHPPATTTPATLQGILNPNSNCFINSAITSFLANDTVKQQLLQVLQANFTNTDNPTIRGLSPESLSSFTQAPLDPDYTKWDIGQGDLSDADKSKADKQALNHTFLNMTIGNAARCASHLLNKIKSTSLTSKESQLLRLCLIKLFQTTPDTRTQQVPHLIMENAPKDIINISPLEYGDSGEFIIQLINGLNGLNGLSQVDESVFTVDNPNSPLFLVNLPIEVTNFGSNSSPQWRLNIENLTEMITPALTAEQPYMIYFQIGTPDGNSGSLPPLDISGYKQLFDETSPYTLESFGVHSEKPRHNWSYRQEKGQWFRYDDAITPNPYPVTQEEIDAVTQGQMRHTSVCFMVFNKK